jgi:hypothetical protein
LLQYRSKIDYTNKNCPDQDKVRMITEKFAVNFWNGTVPGLRTKMMCFALHGKDKSDYLYSTYIFTSKKAHDDFLASDVYKAKTTDNTMMKQENCRSMEIL